MTHYEQKQLQETIHRNPQERERQDNEILSQEISQRIQLINALMVRIFLDSKDISTHNVLPYIRYLFKKFELDGYFSEFDVLIEAYTIAIRKTKEGYVIKNPPAWFKGASLMIVRNLKKESKKQDSVKKELKREQKDSKNIESNESDIEGILDAFKNLREEDRYILKLRIVKGLTWSDIAEEMVEGGKEDTFTTELVPRLRKRCQRALERLRNSYQQQLAKP